MDIIVIDVVVVVIVVVVVLVVLVVVVVVIFSYNIPSEHLFLSRTCPRTTLCMSWSWLSVVPRQEGKRGVSTFSRATPCARKDRSGRLARAASVKVSDASASGAEEGVE